MKDNIIKWTKEFLPYVLIIILVLLIKQFVFTNVMVHGDSMYPTLHNKDLMILNKLSMKTGKLKRFDIVVVDAMNEKIIKRVIGLPGETVEYKNNKLYINGKVVKDKYNINNATQDFGKVILDKDEYFVLGDNRAVSIDSRRLGPIPKKDILGKAKLVIFPFNRFGIK